MIVLFKTLKSFTRSESNAAIVLFIAAVIAMIISNSSLRLFYDQLFNTPLTIGFEHWHLSKPLLLWINEGLMSLFFLSVGLEIKREIIEGELNSVSKFLLPALAAAGGMLVPMSIYMIFNGHDAIARQGFAIPSATDIAFSLGILGLLKSRLPVSLKIFLMAIAIFDDIGAIAIIAIFYTADISYEALGLAAIFIGVLWTLNRCRITHLWPYLLTGLALWLCVLKSGVHATMAGVILAFAIPLRMEKQSKPSLACSLENKIHPWVAFLILPVFAFANSGLSLSGLHWDALYNPITLGIAAGLFLGKQIGITVVTWISIKLGIARLPEGAHGWEIYGLSLIAGVGFTMSLFIGTLAFPEAAGNHLIWVRLGVLIGSVLSGTLGYSILRFRAHPTYHSK
jgi:NhaA family Na+:H+ antiporter